MASLLTPLPSPCLLFLTLLFVLNTTSMSIQLCQPNERSALLQFKHSFSINNSSSGYPFAYPKVESWKSRDCCLWDGVECDEDTGHVTGLDLSSSCLYGSLNSSNSLFRLVHLQRLNLFDNDFIHSEIPSQFGLLSKLTYLNLSYSGFSGQIPFEIADLSSLTLLGLGGNSLELKRFGFERLVQNLTSLEKLNLNSVNISSTLPDVFASLSSLSYLNLWNCNLWGIFPSSLGFLTKLEHLNLADNNFSSTPLPNVFANLSSLSYLNLENCNLWGTVPSTLGFLTKLEVLSLASNNFSGHIPVWLSNFTQLNLLYLSFNNFIQGNLSWLGKLNKLVYLDLRSVNLVGEIPSSLRNMTQLEQLRLGRNQLRGKIPLWFSNLTQLTLLSLSYNQLSGPIPESIFKLAKLEYLSLLSNQLREKFPLSISNLTHLTDLYLGDNELSGPFPEESISKLVNLETLNLEANQLSGTVNFDIFTSLTHLVYLHIPGIGNNFTVLTNNISSNATFPKFRHLSLGLCNLIEFPDFLKHQDELIYLDLSGNNIQGQIPKWLGDIGRETLSVLILSYNCFTGFEEISTLSLLSNLRSLDLGSNKLQGTLPVPAPSILDYRVRNNSFTGALSPLLCELTSLVILDFSSNYLSGVIPHCLGNFSDSLLALSMANNSFHGIIPDSFTTKCSLRLIDLSGNQLLGLLPQTLASCGMLESLKLGQNRISDHFPIWLGNLNKLQILILRSNQFFGSIRTPAAMYKFPALRIIDLAFNNFTGVLPFEFFKHLIRSMRAFDSDEFEYMEATLSFSAQYDFETVHVPYQIILANKGTFLKYWKVSNVIAAIDLSSNKFQGNIPYTIGSLKMMSVLNLSHNHLSGHIPSALENLTNLESLDLSCNMLSGEIPQQLTQITFLEYFNVSHNQLVGPIPQGEQFNTFDNTSYEGNLGLCGQPLSKSSEEFEDSPQLQPNLEEDEDSILPIHIEWIGIVVGYGSGFVIGMVVGWRVIRKNPRWYVRTFGLKRRQPRKRRQARSGGH